MPGVVSFLHRVSGALLFVAIPLVLVAFQLTLSSPAGFEEVKQALNHPLVKLILLAVLWGYSHHFFAGLRFVAMDMGFGMELGQTRRNSWLVFAFSLTLTAMAGAWLW